MKRRQYAFALTLAACAATPGLSVAEENCSGTWVQVGETIVTLTNDPSWPHHMSVGTCELTRCTLWDKDGDSYTNESTYQETGNRAIWKTVSGTGKYENTTASTGWSRIDRTSARGGKGGVFIGTWGGTCTVKR